MDMVAKMRRAAGERIGKHEIICPLGAGGMAEVYLGLSRGPANVRKLVVMKEIRGELARDKRFVTMFLDEARIATRLNHPNVVHTYEVLEEPGTYVLVMEYLEGHSLFEVLQRIDLDFFPIEEHLWILTQVLAGLQYAHALADYDGSPLGVVHRDVSPGNTFLTYNGEVKLLDFGIAKASGAVSTTQEGMFKGKLNYCAPEQIQADAPIDARADIFAVGLMLWEALAGRRIDVGNGFAQLAHVRLAGQEPRIRSIRADADPELAEVCDRAMALRPADRYLTAADFQRDLERCLERSSRRVGRRQVAELMRHHFEMERREMQKRIEAHLLVGRDTQESPRGSALLDDVPEAGLSPTIADRPSGATVSEWTRQTEPGDPPSIGESSTVDSRAFRLTDQPRSSALPEPVAVATSSSVQSSIHTASRSKRLTKTRLFVLLAVCMGLVTADVGTRRHARKTTTAEVATSRSRAPAVASPVPSSTPAPAAPTPAPARPAKTVRLDVTVDPPGARLTLDEHAVDGNRLHTEIPEDPGIHVVRAMAPGFAPFSQSVSFASDLRLDVHLSPLAKAPELAARRPSAARHAKRGGQLRRTVHEQEASERPAVPDEAPGMSLEKPSPPKPPAAIDEANPYDP
jgi:serine/threonine protein kinase